MDGPTYVAGLFEFANIRINSSRPRSSQASSWLGWLESEDLLVSDKFPAAVVDSIASSSSAVKDSVLLYYSASSDSVSDSGSDSLSLSLGKSFE